MTFLQVCLGLDKVHSSISAQQGEINEIHTRLDELQEVLDKICSVYLTKNDEPKKKPGPKPKKKTQIS